MITDHKIHNGVKEVIEYFKWDSVEYCIIPKNKTSKLMHFFLKSVTSKFKGVKGFGCVLWELLVNLH